MKTAINCGQLTAEHLIDMLGGTFRVSGLLGIKPPSVSDWKSLNSIPDDKLIRLATEIESASGGSISREILFPEDWQKIWPELAQSDKCACQS
jgi:DNA-binding transcriptional regulator YdaS (Cro superfamily)